MTPDKSPKGGFKLLKFGDENLEGFPPGTSVFRGCPLPVEKAAVAQACVAEVTEPKKDMIMIDLQMPECAEIAELIPSLPPGNKKFLESHMSVDGKTLKKRAKESKSG